MTKYLYGASVQGIQGYIFATNELKQIVGASEIVEQVCTTLFSKNFAADAQPVVTAAGNIKHIFSDKTALEKAVRLFPKKVAEKAPGITVSQAVVTMDGDYADFGCAVNELEHRLMTQRNRPMKSLTTGLMAIERSRKTGLPAVEVSGGEYVDECTKKKTEALASNDTILKLMKNLTGENVSVRNVALNIKDLTGQNDWIAVIHADGNGLGEVVARVGDDPDKLRDFSLNLDNATKAAAQTAYANIGRFSFKLPIRPVVLSGDDLTVICRADIAIEFVSGFLKAFEEKTEKLIGHKLTACAGIAFIKSSYPFYYGYNLAETLCAEAKKDAKSPEMRRKDGLAPSCLMMHNVQSSFIEDWAEIERKELTTKNGGSYIFGPYYLDEQTDRWTVDKLQSEASRLTDGKDGNAAKTDIREWMTLMADNEGLAEQKANRVNAIGLPKVKSSFNEATKGVKRGGKWRYPAYDILSLVALEIRTKN